jgi:hypothetical protein
MACDYLLSDVAGNGDAIERSRLAILEAKLKDRAAPHGAKQGYDRAVSAAGHFAYPARSVSMSGSN